MIKLRCLIILLILTIPNQVDCSSIARNLTEYDYEDIKDFSKLCDIAYDQKSFYLKEMQDNHWDINFLLTDYLSVPYGIKACNGPLTVIAYAGTDIWRNYQTYLANIKVDDIDCGNFFSKLKNQGSIHTGIAEYYNNLKDYRTVNLLKNFDSDGKVVLVGHSLGGALAVCGAVDILCNQQYQSENYSEKFCSIMTLGSPSFFDRSLKQYINSSFTENSYLRIYFDHDPVANFTLGARNLPFFPHLSDLETGLYVHSGRKIELFGEGLFSHSCHEYIKYINRRPAVLERLWPNIDEQSFKSNFYSIELSDHQISLIQKNYRNPFYTSKAKSLIGLLPYQHDRPRLNIDSRYNYWRHALDSSLKPKHRIKRFEDFYNSYVRVGDKNHSHVFQLSRKLIEHNDLPPKKLARKVLRNLVSASDLEQKDEIIKLCELLLVKNNYQRDLAFSFDKASGLLEFKEFDGNAFAKKAYTDFKKRTLLKLVKDRNTSFSIRFHDLLKLMEIEYDENPLQPSFAEDEIEKMAEDKAFSEIKEKYTFEDIVMKLKVFKSFQVDDQIFLITYNALVDFYQNKTLPVFLKNHLRMNFNYLNLNFNHIFFQEYERIKQNNAFSLIEILSKLPETSIAFNDLVKDMKEKPHLLDEFFNDPIVKAYKFKKDLLQYMKNTY